MADSSSRNALIKKLYKVAKKHFDPIKPPSDRRLLEHMLYACLLENSTYEAADEAFARLEQDYFEWNEVRVTTVPELAGVMKKVFDPDKAALRLRRTLHAMFETHYQFDIDHLKKESLGKAVQTLEKYRGISPFVVSYVAQAGLDGHSIPVDEALLSLLYIIGAITETERDKNRIPGLARVITKPQGVEFASVVHQLAAAFHKSQFSKPLRDIILEIAPDAKDRFPKRGDRKKAEEAARQQAAEEAARLKAEREAKRAASRKSGRKKTEASPTPAAEKVKAAPKSTAKKQPPAKKTTAKQSPAKKTAAKKVTKKSATAKKSTSSTASKKKTAKKKTARATPRKSVKKTAKKKAPAKSGKKTSKKTASKKKSTSKKSPTKRLAKKKPR